MILSALVAGCSSTNVTRLVQAAAKDPAKVHVEVRSPWGTVTYDRDNSVAAGSITNSVVVSPSPGLIVKPQP